MEVKSKYEGMDTLLRFNIEVGMHLIIIHV